MHDSSSSSDGSGGGVLFMEYNKQQLTIINTSHTFCKANSDGGVFCLNDHADVNLIDCSFMFCSDMVVLRSLVNPQA